MKQILFIAVIFNLILFSCKKSDSLQPIPTSLDGKWRMITVKDNATGVTTTKQSTIQGDLDLEFTSTSSTSGTFIGNTPTNSIWINDYSIGANQTIAIPCLAMTKVGESSWGNLFVDNIRSAKEYTFEIDGILNIITINKTLTFQKQ